MSQILSSPGKYVQGTGEMNKIGDYAKDFGKTILCLISKNGLKRFESAINNSFKDSGAKVIYEIFNGECSKKEIARLIDICVEKKVEAVMGVGGGKIFDTIKAVSHYLHLPVIIVPTIAGSDAPCSALSVVYTDDGVFEEYLWLDHNPNMVLVDTQAIANSPTRLLVSGMGDALATYFEARACEQSDADNCNGAKATQAALKLAELCYDTLIEEGTKAKAAADNNVATKALDDIVEANTLLSGIGFESGGLAAAHAIHNGFTALPQTHDKYHGEKVAFGTLAQLVLENAPIDEIEEVINFCLDVGLPVTLAELGIEDAKPEDLRKVAELATAEGETIFNMPFTVTPELVEAAIVTADSLGQKYKALRG